MKHSRNADNNGKTKVLQVTELSYSDDTKLFGNIEETLRNYEYIYQKHI